jgi:hypothetical protein
MAVSKHFRRAVEFGLSVKRETASGFKSRPSRHMAGFPTRLLSVVPFGMGRCASVIELGSSTATEHLVKTRRYGFESRPETSKPSLDHPPSAKPFSTGRRIGLSPPKRVVAGSSPAFGTTRRSSSVVEQRIPSSFLIRRFFQRAVDCGLSELLVGGSNPPFRFGGSSSIG